MQAVSPQSSSTPAISVVIPAYNAAAVLPAALASVFSQTAKPLEVIVVNDGSPDTDQMEDAIKPYLDRVVYLKQENQGPSAARNTAIRAAKGEYIALLDSDDSWLPEFLDEQISVIQKDPALDLVYCDALLVGDGSLAGKTFMETAPSNGPVSFENLLRYEVSIITSCAVARRQTLIDAGLFDPAFIRCEDFDLWIRLAHRGARMAFQRKVLGEHRIHKTSLAADSIKMIESLIQVLKKAQKTLDLTPEQSALIQSQLLDCEARVNLERGKRHLLLGDYKSARNVFQQANDFYRSPKLKCVMWALRAAPKLTQTFYRVRYGRTHGYADHV